MSVTKNSNQNHLQQVKMRLRHVYFHRTCNTTWSTAHASCIILWTFEDTARSSYMKTLAYTTGTTSKHQRATWPELYPKLIVFLLIVVRHKRVFSHLPNVWGYGEGMLHAAMLSKTMTKLEHDILHSTVWPMHKICQMPVCWRPNPTCTKRILFWPILPGMISL